MRKRCRLKQAADKECLDKIAEAKLKAKEIVHAKVESARKEAELIRQEKLKQAEGEKEAILKNENVLNKLVEDICKIIISTDDVQ